MDGTELDSARNPRSANLNTEAGLLVESPELTAQVIDYMDEGVRQENSYRVGILIHPSLQIAMGC